MTPHYWQLFASQQTDLLLLPPFTGTWIRFRSGAITSWCMILNPNKTEALVLSRSRTVNHPRGNLVYSRFPFTSDPTSTSMAWSLTANLHSKNIDYRVSEIIVILLVVKRIYEWVDTSVLLRYYWAFFLKILEFCSPVWGSAASASRAPCVFGF